jgi:hypothetical protein
MIAGGAGMLVDARLSGFRIIYYSPAIVCDFPVHLPPYAPSPRCHHICIDTIVVESHPGCETSILTELIIILIDDHSLHSRKEGEEEEGQNEGGGKSKRRSHENKRRREGGRKGRKGRTGTLVGFP